MRNATSFLLREALVVAVMAAAVIAIPKTTRVHTASNAVDRPIVASAVSRPADSPPAFAALPAARSPYGRL
jgi:hypothetical protein